MKRWHCLYCQNTMYCALRFYYSYGWLPKKLVAKNRNEPINGLLLIQFIRSVVLYVLWILQDR